MEARESSSVETDWLGKASPSCGSARHIYCVRCCNLFVGKDEPVKIQKAGMIISESHY